MNLTVLSNALFIVCLDYPVHSQIEGLDLRLTNENMPNMQQISCPVLVMT